MVDHPGHGGRSHLGPEFVIATALAGLGDQQGSWLVGEEWHGDWNPESEAFELG